MASFESPSSNSRPTLGTIAVPIRGDVAPRVWDNTHKKTSYPHVVRLVEASGGEWEVQCSGRYGLVCPVNRKPLLGEGVEVTVVPTGGRSVFGKVVALPHKQIDGLKGPFRYVGRQEQPGARVWTAIPDPSNRGFGVPKVDANADLRTDPRFIVEEFELDQWLEDDGERTAVLEAVGNDGYKLVPTDELVTRPDVHQIAQLPFYFVVDEEMEGDAAENISSWRVAQFMEPLDYRVGDEVVVTPVNGDPKFIATVCGFDPQAGTVAVQGLQSADEQFEATPDALVLARSTTGSIAPLPMGDIEFTVMRGGGGKLSGTCRCTPRGHSIDLTADQQAQYRRGVQAWVFCSDCRRGGLLPLNPNPEVSVELDEAASQQRVEYLHRGGLQYSCTNTAPPCVTSFKLTGTDKRTIEEKGEVEKTCVTCGAVGTIKGKKVDLKPAVTVRAGTVPGTAGDAIVRAMAQHQATGS